ncbi:MAG: protein-disulfide reductase DsbD family protein, partial [Ignavibacteria bacterium]|nr:protein-disulfide reductase DsbD family protein [Ignavibacteria bacterium]
IQIELISEKLNVTQGDTIRFIIKIKPRSGWHIYWINPGDAGGATLFSVKSNVHSNDSVGVLYSPPELSIENDIVSFEYSKETYFPFTLSVPQNFYGTFLEVSIDINWVACKFKCVPGSTTVCLKLPFSLYPKRKKNLEKIFKKALSSASFDSLETKVQFYTDYSSFEINLGNHEEVKNVLVYPITPGILDISKIYDVEIMNSKVFLKIPYIQYVWGDTTDIQALIKITYKNNNTKYFKAKFVK